MMMMNPRSLEQPHTAHVLAVAVALLIGDVITTVTVADADANADSMDYRKAAAKAQALGVMRTDSGVVSIDFDVPRYGPLCISVDENDGLEFVWEEYHNLHQLADAVSFADCDFSDAVALAPDGSPRPLGYRIDAASTVDKDERENERSARYFACSKICASNGHKAKVCAGGGWGRANECGATTECLPERTIDLRRTESAAEAVAVTQGPRDYVPVGTVCRPKNGDGYAIASGFDSPESCQRKCDDDAARCGAWEFEDYGLDDKECELHEIDVVSHEETLAMGDCLTTGEDYRCCWIARDVVEAQLGTKSMGDEGAPESMGDEDASKSMVEEDASKSMGDEEASKSMGGEEASKSMVDEDVYKSVDDEDASRSIVDDDASKPTNDNGVPSSSWAHRGEPTIGVLWIVAIVTLLASAI